MKFRKILTLAGLLSSGFLLQAQEKGEETFQSEMVKTYPNYNKAVELLDQQLQERNHGISNSEIKHFKRSYFLAKNRLDENGTLENYLDLFNSSSRTLTQCQDNEANWQYSGPTNSLYHGNNMYGIGRVDAVDVHPNDDQTILCGSASGGIWKKTVNSNGWYNVTDNLNIPFLGISSIKRDPFNPQHLLAGTGYLPLGGNFGSAGILESFDGGENWSKANFPAPAFGNSAPVLYDLPVLDIEFDPGIQGVVYALQERNIVYRSTDGGTSWPQRWDHQHNSNNTLPDFNTHINLRRLDLGRDANNNLILIASGFKNFSNGFNHIYRFDGSNWSTTPLYSNDPIRGVRIAMSPTDPNIIYLLEISLDSITGSAIRNLKKSSDGGLTFNFIDNISGSFGTSTTEMQVSHFDNNKIYMFSLSNSNAQIYDVQTTSSTPIVGFTYHDDPRYSILYKKNNEEIVYLTHDGGVSTYQDGVGGSDLDWTGLNITQYYGFDTPKNDGSKIIGGTQDNGTSYYDGGLWDHISGGDGGRVVISEFNAQNYWLNLNAHTDYERPGVGTRRVTSPLDFWQILGNEMAESKNPSEEHWLYLSWSTDYPNNPVKTPYLMKADFDHNPPLRYKVSPYLKSLPTTIEIASKKVILLATESIEKDPSQVEKGLLITRNETQTWQNITPHFPDANGIMQSSYINGNYITDIEVESDFAQADGSYTGEIYLTYGGYNKLRTHDAVIRSTDGGLTWENYGQGLPDVPAMALEYQRNKNGRLFVGTDLGIYYRDKGMSEWKCFSNGLPATQVSELKINYCRGKLLASTFGRGIYETDIDFDSQNITQTISTDITTNQNINFKGNMKITNGATVTINNATIEMAVGSSIHIDKGATLILDNTTITRACETFWDGIFVYGTANDYGGTTQSQPANQSIGEAGRLILRNSTVEYAKNGVRLRNPYNWAEVGGVVQATNTFFKNNKRAVEFIAYENHDPITGAVVDNLSYFEECEFIYDDMSVDAGQSFVTLWKVRGIEFKGCKFEDKVSSSPRTLGVSALNAGIRFKNINNPFTGTTVVNTFKNLKSAVVITAESPNMRRISVSEAEFYGCEYPITVDGMDNVTITKNSIRSGLKWDTEIGIRLLACTGFHVEENTILKPNPISKNLRIGIGAAYTGGDANMLYRNNITDAQWAILGNGANYDLNRPNEGLTFRCNRFSTETMDVASLGSQPSDGFAKIIGTAFDNRLAFNTFTPNPTPNSSSQIFNFATNNMIYTTRANDANNVYLPTEVLPGKVAVYLSFPGPNVCNALLKMSPATASEGDLSEAKQEFVQAKREFSRASTEYLNEVDGGNTAALLLQIQRANSSNQRTLKDQLMANSPLSTRVMYELISVNVLSNDLLFEVLSSNAHVAREENLISMLETKTPAMHRHMIDDIKNRLDNRALIVQLQEKMSSYLRTARAQQLDIISYYQQDTITPPDSLLEWQNKWNNYEERRWRIGNEYDRGNYQVALANYQDIEKDLTLTHAETIEYRNVKDYLSTYNLILESQTTSGFSEINTHLNSLAPFLSIQNKAGRYARNMGYLLQDQLYEQDPITVPSTNGKQKRIINSKLDQTQLRTLKVYPNPASDHLSIDWSEQESIDGIKQLNIFDASGRLVKEVVLNQENQQIKLNDLKAGQYLFGLFVEEKQYNSGSFTIVR